MKAEFEKAMVEAKHDDGFMGSKTAFMQGANCAYEWCDANIYQHPEYNKLVIFFEQFGDLSGCYDSEDIVKFGQSKLDQQAKIIEELKGDIDRIYQGVKGGKASLSPGEIENICAMRLARFEVEEMEGNDYELE